MYRYEIIVYWSEQDNAFIAEVTESLGYMADDSSYQEVMKNVQVIIRERIETATQ